MTLLETSAALESTSFEKVCFILDASESAAQHQSTIIELVREVLSVLPLFIPRTLYFLGNPSAYAPHHFASRATQWFIENRLRASLVTPVWETFDQDDKSIFVIIGAGRIFDLENWEETWLAQRTLLVKVGESLQGGLHIAEEIAHPTAQQLRERLHDPVVGVEISGRGFMPTWWDNAKYQLHLVGGQALLIAERLEAYSLSLRFFTTSDGEVQVVTTHASGKQVAEPLAPIDPTALVEAEASWLNADEVEIFQSASQQKPFTCLHCGKAHPWNTLRCREGAIILGKVVYPSLQARNSFVIFQTVEDGVHVAIHQGSVLRLGEGEVAIREGQNASIYRFNAWQERWMRTDTLLTAYHSIGGQAHAIFL